jgi:hypothetical protein
MASGTCAWSIDNLELSEFGEIFLGEFRADARLLGAARTEYAAPYQGAC